MGPFGMILLACVAAAEIDDLIDDWTPFILKFAELLERALYNVSMSFGGFWLQIVGEP